MYYNHAGQTPQLRVLKCRKFLHPLATMLHSWCIQSSAPQRAQGIFQKKDKWLFLVTRPGYSKKNSAMFL